MTSKSAPECPVLSTTTGLIFTSYFTLKIVVRRYIKYYFLIKTSYDSKIILYVSVIYCNWLIRYVKIKQIYHYHNKTTNHFRNYKAGSIYFYNVYIVSIYICVYSNFINFVFNILASF